MITKKAKFTHVLKNVLFKKIEPVSIVHFLTNRCNARCSFCFIDFDDPNTFKNELTLNEIDKLTKSLGKSLLNVNLTGGEPFARKDITEIGEIYLKNKKEFWSTIWDFTNIIGEKKHPIIEKEKDFIKSAFFKNSKLNFTENLLKKKDDDDAIVFFF